MLQRLMNRIRRFIKIKQLQLKISRNKSRLEIEGPLPFISAIDALATLGYTNGLSEEIYAYIEQILRIPSPVFRATSLDEMFSSDNLAISLSALDAVAFSHRDVYLTSAPIGNEVTHLTLTATCKIKPHNYFTFNWYMTNTDMGLDFLRIVFARGLYTADITPSVVWAVLEAEMGESIEIFVSRQGEYAKFIFSRLVVAIDVDKKPFSKERMQQVFTAFRATAKKHGWKNEFDGVVEHFNKYFETKTEQKESAKILAFGLKKSSEKETIH